MQSFTKFEQLNDNRAVFSKYTIHTFVDWTVAVTATLKVGIQNKKCIRGVLHIFEEQIVWQSITQCTMGGRVSLC